MKAILEFDLPVDSEAHRDAVQGSDWRWAIQEALDYLRTQTKHVDHSADAYEAFDRVREKIIEILTEVGLDIRR